MLTANQENFLKNLENDQRFQGSYKVEPVERQRYKLTASWVQDKELPFNAMTGLLLPNGCLIQRRLVTLNLEEVFHA